MNIPATVKNQSNGKKLLMAWAIVLAAWIIMTLAPFAYKSQSGRIFADHYDRSVYFERGKWFLTRTAPISEYPQVPTFLFGINHVLVSWVDQSMQMETYIVILSLEMLIVLFLVFKLLLELLPPHLSNYAFLVLLPSSLYFTYNRFDILPACLCILAYMQAIKRRWGIVSIILAIATFTKWYPALLFPGFFVYASNSESKTQWKMILFFLLTSIAILMPTYMIGGLEAIIAPYQTQMARGMEFIALPVLTHSFLNNTIGVSTNPKTFLLFFFALQFLAPSLLLVTKMVSLESLVHYCIIVVGTFILFSRIWSPQWFLWLLPFLVLSTKNLKDAGFIVAYSSIMYICFPLIFDRYGANSPQLRVLGIIGYLILSAIILRSILYLKEHAQPTNNFQRTRNAIQKKTSNIH